MYAYKNPARFRLKKVSAAYSQLYGNTQESEMKKSIGDPCEMEPIGKVSTHLTLVTSWFILDSWKRSMIKT